jgi:hypothetical protein
MGVAGQDHKRKLLPLSRAEVVPDATSAVHATATSLLNIV